MAGSFCGSSPGDGSNAFSAYRVISIASVSAWYRALADQTARSYTSLAREGKMVGLSQNPDLVATPRLRSAAAPTLIALALLCVYLAIRAFPSPRIVSKYLFYWLPGTEPKSGRKALQSKAFLISVWFRYPKDTPSKRWLLPVAVG
jgi:hypothetical protein